MQELIKANIQKVGQGLDGEWLVPGNSRWYTYIDSLDDDLQVTYHIAVLNQQVCNGSFVLYYDNRFGVFALRTIESLLKIGAVHSADLLKKSFDVVNPSNLEESAFREELNSGELYEHLSNPSIIKNLEMLSVDYLDNEEDVVELLSTYLLNQQ